MLDENLMLDTTISSTIKVNMTTYSELFKEQFPNIDDEIFQYVDGLYKIIIILYIELIKHIKI